MKPGDRVTLRIDKPAAGGRMIARSDGAVVLVAGAIPGEAVEAVIEKIQRGTIWAQTTAVVEASPDRLEQAGDGACGGNVFAHVRYERQLVLKGDIVRDAFTRLGRLALPGDMPIDASPDRGYRMRARLHVHRGRIGFYREGTHTLCDPASTGQLLSATIETLASLEAAIRRVPSLESFEIELSENVPASERAVHIQLPHATLGQRLRSLPPLAGITGLSARAPTSARVQVLSGSTLLGDAFEVSAHGTPITVKIERHAQSFFQGNRFLLGPLMSAVAGLVPEGRVLDLYAGVGPFAMTLATRGHADITAVEGDASAAADLNRNAARAAGRVVVRHQAVEAFLAAPPLREVATAIVDPPRTGLSREAARGLVGLRPRRIVYVSCDVATAARDARLLADAGYELISLRAFDMFPNTAHVETLMLFER
jgi:23S rRNA (uracil1939-C5)-methyltransferase